MSDQLIVIHRVIYGQLERPNFVANIDRATELHNSRKNLKGSIVVEVSLIFPGREGLRAHFHSSGPAQVRDVPRLRVVARRGPAAPL